MRCVTVDGTGHVVDVVPQPVDLSTCTAVLVSGVEVNNSPFALTADDAVTLLWLIVPIWTVAWIFRAFNSTTER